MTKSMTTAEARREWAKVLKSAARGTTVEITRNGQPVAAVISIEKCRSLEGKPKKTLSDVIAAFRARVDPCTLEGPDPWANVRDRSPGREIDL